MALYINAMSQPLFKQNMNVVPIFRNKKEENTEALRY